MNSDGKILFVIGAGQLLIDSETSWLIYWRHPSILSAEAGRPAAPTWTLIHFSFSKMDKIQAEQINQPAVVY